MVRGNQLLFLTVLVASFVVSTQSAILISLNRDIETKKVRNETSEPHELDTNEIMKTKKEKENYLLTTYKEVVSIESATLTSLNRDIEKEEAQNETVKIHEPNTEKIVEETIKTLKEKVNHLPTTNKKIEESFIKELVAEIDKKNEEASYRMQREEIAKMMKETDLDKWPENVDIINVVDITEMLKNIDKADNCNGGAVDMDEFLEKDNEPDHFNKRPVEI